MNLIAIERARTETTAAASTPPTIRQLLEQLPDTDADVHESALISIEAARVRRLVRALPVLERKVVSARYGLIGQPVSCRRLAAQLGISRRRLSAIEEAALDRLRSMYELPEAA